MTAEDHRRAFTAFVAGLPGDFHRYLPREDVDLVRDGVGYRQRGLWLTDDELVDLLRDPQAVVAAPRRPRPSRGAFRRLLSSVLMLTDDTASPD